MSSHCQAIIFFLPPPLMEPKTSKIAWTDEPDDRLSSLPDEILSHVLSFLPTKYAVATAVLSQRWKHLWAMVSDIDLDNSLVFSPLTKQLACENLPPDQAGELYREGIEALQRLEIIALRRPEWMKFRPMTASGYRSRVISTLSSILSNIQYCRYLDFSRFIDNVLQDHHNLSRVRRFRLHYDVKKPFVARLRLRPDLWFYWFEKAVTPSESELEELDVKIQGEINELPYRMIPFPDCFYTPKHLKVLKLQGVILESAHVSVLLPCVSILQLVRVKTMGCASFSRLISACPVLQTAHLENCGCSKSMNDEEEDIVVASIPSLTKFTIIGGRGGDDTTARIRWVCPIVAMEAPSLEHLHVQDFAELQLVGSRLSCLVSARVDIDESRVLDRCMIGFLAQLSNAKELYLARQTMSLLSVVVSKDVQLPVFPNLTHLTIEPAGRSCLLLHSLLNSASKLRSLVIDLGSDRGAMEWESSEEAAAWVPKCLLSSLEEIEIKSLVAEENQTKMAAYLLKTGAVLKMKKVNNMCLVDDGDLQLVALRPNPPRGGANNNAKEDSVKLDQIEDDIVEELKDIIDDGDPEKAINDMLSFLKAYGIEE